jgi:hypothetical protein
MSLRGRMERLKEAFLIGKLVASERVVTWDQSSLFIVMNHWLGRMQEIHEKVSCHLNAHRYARQIKFCRLLLKRFETEWHEEHFFNAHYEKYPMSWKKKSDEAREDFRRAHQQAEALYQKDMKRLFRVIARFNRHWWF